jgi:hypothetical protein
MLLTAFVVISNNIVTVKRWPAPQLLHQPHCIRGRNVTTIATTRILETPQGQEDHHEIIDTPDDDTAQLHR